MIGDLHGQFKKLCALLLHAGLTDTSLNWQGRNATLVFMSDFFDRSPDGIGCVDLIMRLQDQAHAAGREVLALLGNHEIMILLAQQFSQRLTNGPGGSFLEDWRSMWMEGCIWEERGLCTGWKISDDMKR